MKPGRCRATLRRLGETENAFRYDFRRETRRRDYPAITRATRQVTELRILLSGSAVNPEIDG